MKRLQRSIRHYYWLLTLFGKKNARSLIASFVVGFFVILLIINIFPLFNTLFFQNREIVGLVGQYTLQQLPPDITSQISSPLIRIDQNGEIKPVLANSWEILNEGKTYRFHLKTDLYWTDGKRFNAFNINYQFQDVKIEPIDEYTIDFNLEQPLNIFPIYLTRPVIKNPLIGVGPLYDVENFEINNNVVESIHLSPNKPDLPLRVYRFYNSEDDLITAYKKGEITTFSTPNRTVAELFANWNNSEITREPDFTKIMTLFLNTESSILQERDARKALANASPPFPDNGVSASGPIPPTSWAYTEDTREYVYNTERAASLIDDYIQDDGAEGEESSRSGEFTLYTFFDHIDIAEELKKNFEEIGLKINLRIVSVEPNEFDMFLAVWNPPTDPDQYFMWHSTQGTNLTKFVNLKIDKLLEEGRRVVNVKQRQAIYEDFQKNIVEEVPAHFLYHPYSYVIERK